jgi:hypothetical protein
MSQRVEEFITVTEMPAENRNVQLSSRAGRTTLLRAHS